MLIPMHHHEEVVPIAFPTTASNNEEIHKLWMILMWRHAPGFVTDALAKLISERLNVTCVVADSIVYEWIRKGIGDEP